MQNVESDTEIGQKGAFCKGLIIKVYPCNVSKFFKLVEECTVGKKIIIDFEQAKYFLLKKMNLLSNIEKIKKVVDSATQMSALLKTGLRFSRNKS